MKTIGSALILALAVMLLTTIMITATPSCLAGLVSGRGSEPTTPTDVERTPEQISRNAVWTLFNNRCVLPDDAPERNLLTNYDAHICWVLTPFVTDEIRIDALERLKESGAIRYNADELPGLATALRDGSTDTKIGLMCRLAADSEGGIRIQSIIVDHERMRQFLWGEQIALE